MTKGVIALKKGFFRVATTALPAAAASGLLESSTLIKGRSILFSLSSDDSNHKIFPWPGFPIDDTDILSVSIALILCSDLNSLRDIP